MIKLTFDSFSFTTDGTISTAKICATINCFVRSKWQTVATKQFKIKLTLKDGDAPDLNKAYKIAKARLEQRAYMWANYEATKELENQKYITEQLTAFSNKASHIVSHNAKYIKEL